MGEITRSVSATCLNVGGGGPIWGWWCGRDGGRGIDCTRSERKSDTAIVLVIPFGQTMAREILTLCATAEREREFSLR